VAGLLALPISALAVDYIEDTHVIDIHYLKDKPRLCYDILTEVFPEDGVWGFTVRRPGSREIRHPEQDERDPYLSSMRCASDGTLSVKVGTELLSPSMRRSYGQPTPGPLIRTFSGYFIASVCDRLRYKAYNADKAGKQKLFQNMNAEINRLPAFKDMNASYDSKERPMTRCKPWAKPLYALTVNATPSGARVQIMNITPKYYPGIKVRPGHYDIKISKAGYITKRVNLTMKAYDGSIRVTLDPIK